MLLLPLYYSQGAIGAIAAIPKSSHTVNTFVATEADNVTTNRLVNKRILTANIILPRNQIRNLD